MFKLLPIIGLLLSPVPALAQEKDNCGPRADILRVAKQQFGLDIIFAGIVGDGRLMLEIGTNPEKGQWIMLLTDQGGTTCISLGGESFDVIIVPNA